MAVCAAYGIPHSTFASWDQDDRDKALWWHIHRAETCQSCGTRPEEWDEDRGGDRFAYAAVPVHCRGCEVRAGAEERFDRNKKEYRRGTRIELRRPEPEPEEEVPDSGGDRIDSDQGGWPGEVQGAESASA